MEASVPRSDSANVVIRWWSPADAEELARQADDRGVWVHMRDAFPSPYRLEDAERFIAMAQAMDPQTYFAVTAFGRIAGGIGYMPRADVERVGAEVGYWLGREFSSMSATVSKVRCGRARSRTVASLISGCMRSSGRSGKQHRNSLRADARVLYSADRCDQSS